MPRPRSSSARTHFEFDFEFEIEFRIRIQGPRKACLQLASRSLDLVAWLEGKGHHTVENRFYYLHESAVYSIFVTLASWSLLIVARSRYRWIQRSP